jgi:hypothetical protein
LEKEKAKESGGRGKKEVRREKKEDEKAGVTKF